MRQGYRVSVRWMAGTALASALIASWAAPGWATTLREALVSAYQTNPDLEAGRALLRATDELVPQALAGYRPSLFLNSGVEAARGEIGRGTRSTGQDRSQTANRTSKQVALSVRQNLYAGGSTAAGVRQAENQVSAARANLISTEQQVLLDAITAYTDAWRDKSVLDLALNNEQRLRRQLRATRDRFEVGEVARTDVAQAEARLSRARADIETAKANLAASRAEYRRVIGTDPGVLDDPQGAEGLPPSLEQALAIAANNPDIINATYTLAAAREAVDVAYGNILPSLDLQSDLSYADQPNASQPWQDEASIGLALTIPLYQGGAEYAQVRQAREQALQNRSTLESAQRSVRENAARTWDQVYAARAAIRSFQDEVRANRIALDGVQQEALVGSRTVLDVLDAEQELFTSQVNLVRARRDYVVVTYQLKAAIGELTVDDLKLGIETYNPVVYYERNRTRLFGLDGAR